MAASPRRPAARARILAQARADFFAQGYSAFTMDGLAAATGMSKKTLYVHFAGKDAIIREVLLGLGRDIRADAAAILRRAQPGFAAKLRAFATGMVRRLAPVHPRCVRDLQTHAPALHRVVVDMRQRNIPSIFRRFIAEGKRTGMVRADVESGFAVEFFLHAMQALMMPAALERLRLGPAEMCTRAIDLFFGGLLTSAGCRQHEKFFRR